MGNARGFRVPLGGGVNFSVPRTELQPGELALARNCHYTNDTPQLAKRRGRTLFGTMGATARGLDYVSFTTAGEFLIGAAGHDFYTSPAVGPGAGTFTARTSGGLSSVGLMEALYFNGADRAYVSDGVNRMHVWDGSGNMREAGGLQPPVPVVVFSAGASTTLYTIGTTFTYCYTEYDPTNDVESTPSDVARAEATITAGVFKITFPAAMTNVTFTKIRLYRTQAGGDVFYRLAEFTFSPNHNYYDGTNYDAGSPATTNNDIWGFDTVDDLFLTTQPTLPMVGEPLRSNYITVNGSIPRGNIMFMFENALVITGVSAYPQDVYYSEPDFPENFSPINFLRIENTRGEPVTAGGVANDRAMFFTTNSIYRLNTLPRVTDPGFGLGNASRELVTDDHGCIAKRSVVNFGVGQPNNRLFYLSARGPMMTDGYATTPLLDDIDWSQRLYNFSAMSRAVAVNYPKYSQIILHLPSAGSTSNDIALVYHYHPNHFKSSEGNSELPVGKWTGPCHVRASAAAVAHELDTETRLFIADADGSGKVYLEDNGFIDEQFYENAEGEIDWEWQTGDFPFGEESANRRAQRVYVNVLGTDSFNPTLKFAMNKSDSEHIVPLVNITHAAASTVQFGTSIIQERKTRSYRGGIHQTGNHIRLRMQETAVADRQIASIEVEIQPFGRQR